MACGGCRDRRDVCFHGFQMLWRSEHLYLAYSHKAVNDWMQGLNSWIIRETERVLPKDNPKIILRIDGYYTDAIKAT